MNGFDPRTLGLISGVLVLLSIASVVVRVLRRRVDSGIDMAIVDTLRHRIHAWWVLFSVLAAAYVLGQSFLGHAATVVLFGGISFWALREFITLTPTRPGDHWTLVGVFFIATPLQFVLVGLGNYQVFSLAIPLYAILLIPAQIAMAGDYKRFLERSAKIQAGLLICVYSLSYAPALLTLQPAPEQTLVARPAASQGDAGEDNENRAGTQVSSQNARERELTRRWDPHALVFFFVLMVQLSDALQYAWSQIPSRHVIVPTINPTKTWEGLLGGTVSVTLIGAALWWATPFHGADWWMAALMAMICSLMGFAGSLSLSAIKRDRGVQDYGTLVEGHGGVLDRIDSLCFVAPVFFHVTQAWLVA